MQRVPFRRDLFYPKNWLSWFGVGCWWLFVQCFPYRLQCVLGDVLGGVLLKVAKSRCHIARVNIDLCFPELSELQKASLLRANMRSTAMGFFESGAAWFWPSWRIKKHFSVIGLEHLEAVRAQGKGVLFMGIHFTTIEIGAAFVNTVASIDGFYRPHKNAVYEYVQAFGRVRRNAQSRVIPNGDVRGIVRALRQGRAVNYAPDQDYGRRRSVFVPFFNVPAATVKAPSQLAKAGNAEVVPWVTRRKPCGDYEVEIYPPITDQFGGGEEQDALVINRFVEARVLDVPEQYLWVHRRFKTRPEGASCVY